MDISVSRLNKRMALQLPAEFPLGLVFVVGEVKNLSHRGDGVTPSDFYIEEHNHRLHCRLSSRAAAETHIMDGDLIRAGGHLVFEPAQAGYYLLARDVEVLSEDHPDPLPLSQIKVDNVERTFVTQLVPAEIPFWVELLAPPEVQADLKRQTPEPNTPQVSGAKRRQVDLAQPSMANPAEDPALASLNDDLIEFLSEAMDGQEDIELTPELLAGFKPVPNNSGPSDQDLDALKELEAALFMTIMREDSRPEVAGTEQLAEETRNEVDRPYDFRMVEGAENNVVNSAATIDDLADGKIVPSEPSSAIRSQQKVSEKQEISSRKEVAQTSMSMTVANSAIPPSLPLVSATQAKAVAAGQGQQLVVPWYLVVLAMAVVLLFVATFVIVALNSTVLPLPFSLP
jgi:hypothetical protein